MKKFLLLALLFCSCFAQPQFEEFSITTDVGLTHVYEEMRIRVVNMEATPLTNFSYSLGYDPGEVYSEINKAKVTPKVIIEDGTWTLVFDYPKPLLIGDSEELLIRFRADQLVTISENTRDFRFRFSPQYLTKKFRMQVILPAGGMLAERKTAAQTLPVVFPEAAIGTNGRRISVEWNEQNVNSEKVYLMTFELPIRQVKTSYWWIILIPLAIAGVVLYSMDIRWKSTLSALDEQDKRVLDEIRKRPGIPARELVSKTGLTKVKIFRVTQRLEARGLIRIDKHANRTRIYLADKLQGVLNPAASLKHVFAKLKTAKSEPKQPDIAISSSDKPSENEEKKEDPKNTQNEQEDTKEIDSDFFDEDETKNNPEDSEK